MNKETESLIKETHRLAGATALQVQNLQNNLSHLESLVKDMHCDVLERPAEKKVVLLKTAPFGANPSEVVQEYEDSKAIQEIRDTLQKMREDLLKPRTAGAYAPRIQWLGSPTTGVDRKCNDPLCPICHPTPPPPKPPRLSEQFAQFMQEAMERRGYIYRYARYPEYRKLWYGTDVYFKMHTDLYDSEEFLNLLAETPRKCII